MHGNTFTLCEDDGITLGYEQESSAAVVKTVFTWVDATKTLSWAVSGGGGSYKVFVDMEATLFEPSGVKHTAV